VRDEQGAVQPMPCRREVDLAPSAEKSQLQAGALTSIVSAAFPTAASVQHLP
jgi:hypothetical protein